MIDKILDNIKQYFRWQYTDQPGDQPVNPAKFCAPSRSEADRLSDDPIRNGIHAEQLLNDPLFKACFEHVRQGYLRKFENTALGDMEGLRMAQLSLAALIDVKRVLLTYRFNGQTASTQQTAQNMPQRSRPIAKHK